jgi:hypothetical protein
VRRGGGWEGRSGWRLGPIPAQRGESTSLQAVFLKSAVGFAGLGSLDEAGIKSGGQVVFPEGGTMGEAQFPHAFEGEERTV